MRFKKALVLFVFAGLAVAQGTQAPSCAVVGFLNEIENQDWRDGRVGLGVCAMLSQALFESRCFTLLDEKAEIKGRLQEIAKSAWLGRKGGATLDSAAMEMKKAGARFMASGRVYYFGKPRTRASVGPAHFSGDEVEIKIEVTLLSISDGKRISAIGTGKAKTTALSGLFTFHDENLDADKSMVGTATRKAIDAAVAEITKKYRKAYKPAIPAP